MYEPIDDTNPAALATLSEILTYVAPKLFTATGLARGLRRDVAKIEAELQWLKERGFVEQMNDSSSMRVAQKSWGADTTEISDSHEFEIVFTTAPKKEHENSPVDDDEADFFNDLRSRRESRHGS